ncbi:SH3 domain-containing kinase-binding protein 1-like isoform X3 [Asterias rubens]|uniref:SH3 domain-containing kinase-binding protein 1-like isoform X3 n=1 Tax=Asterias rubens TaxID=7604 RepID=UPI0014555A44|nr:SH3 domain-containing kinase-binding protein 1-like isoform X3 [Asterias rubens]
MAEAVVTFDYEATQDDELTLKEGQIITNINMMEEGWWEGELNGQRGLFPDNFVELKKAVPEKAVPEKAAAVRAKAPTPPPPEAVNGESQEVLRREGSEKRKAIRAKVVFSYVPQKDDEIGLQVDEVISVTSQPEDGWWEGVLRGKKGMFPSNFVSLIDGNEAVGPEDAGDGAEVKSTERPVLSDETPAEVPKAKPPKVKGVGFGNIFAGGEVKLRKTGGNSTADHSKTPPAARSSELAQKRLSLKRAVPIPSAKSSETPVETKKAEPRKDIKPEYKKEERKDKKEEEQDFEEIIKERAKVTFSYEAQHSDELELKEGDIVTIIDRDAADSGWWLGEVDGRKGVFPDNFVTMLPPEKEKVKKKAPMPARPTSVVPRPPQSETKIASSKSSVDSAAPPKPSQPPPSSSPETSSTQSKEDAPRRPSHPTTQPRDETNRKPHPQAAPKPALPIPSKKPAVKSKPPPPKPSGPPPTAEREEPHPAVVLRRRPPVNETQEGEVGLDDIKADSPQKLTHITLSRPKNTNRRPPSVFGGQGGNLSDSPPVENGTAAPPPRPKSSPIGPLTGIVTAQSPSVTVTNSKGQTDSSSAMKKRPTSLISDNNNASNAQVEELKKDIKTLQDQMVSVKSDMKKEVVKLMTELDEEKKLRMAMQVELDRIKKLVLEKD